MLLVIGLVVAGCDSSGGMDDDSFSTDSSTISGQVTDDEASNGSKAAKANVEGATVTAVHVHADGTTTTLDGEATTDANGEYTITIEGEGASDVVYLTANDENGFSSSVLVDVHGESEIDAQPMTVETSAEADVYIEAKGEADSEESHDDGVTLADVTAYVDSSTAAAVEAGNANRADIATAIRNTVETEAAYHSEANSNVDVSAIAATKSDAFTQLQADLAAAADASARASAVESFEATMGSLYTDAGASAHMQAQARQASTSHLIEFSGSAETSSGVALGLRKQAELFRAYATAQANETIFEAEGATQTSLDALADARSTLLSEIRAATSTDAIVDAKINYNDAVENELKASFDIDAATILSAKSGIEGTLSTLEAALADLSSLLESAVETSVNAYSTFYTEAQSSAETALSNSADAEVCASVIVMLEAF